MTDQESFKLALKRGREFEAEERAGWDHIPADSIEFEAPTKWKGRRGRIDIVVDDGSGLVAIVETKATDWDKIKHSRIGENARRHARQLWRYIDDYVETREVEVSPGLVYPFEPQSNEVRAAVEAVLDKQGIQCVWRKAAPPNPLIEVRDGTA